MTYEELKKLAAAWNMDGKRVKPDSPREIILLDVSDVTAVAKLKRELRHLRAAWRRARRSANAPRSTCPFETPTRRTLSSRRFKPLVLMP